MMTGIFRQAFSKFVGGRKSQGVKKALVPVLFFNQNMSSQPPKVAAVSSSGVISPQKNLSKNLNLYSSSLQTKEYRHRPLAIILNWMLAKRRHIMKFGDFYLDQGFDVLTVNITPLQLLLPITGAHLVADEVLKFVANSPEYKSVVIHGFSVGGYLYGEMLFKMHENAAEYGQVAERIVGQVFDSAVDFYNIPFGLSKAITNNRSIQKWLQLYIRYHMRIFHESSTQYYLRSSDQFHNNRITCPSLFYFSNDDPVGTAEGNLRVIDEWEKNGVNVFVKRWESSPHVGHLHHHTQEYMEELAAFLDTIDLLALPLAPIKKKSKL